MNDPETRAPTAKPPETADPETDDFYGDLSDDSSVSDHNNTAASAAPAAAKGKDLAVAIYARAAVSAAPDAAEGIVSRHRFFIFSDGFKGSCWAETYCKTIWF